MPKVDGEYEDEHSSSEEDSEKEDEMVESEEEDSQSEEEEFREEEGGLEFGSGSDDDEGDDDNDDADSLQLDLYLPIIFSSIPKSICPIIFSPSPIFNPQFSSSKQIQRIREKATLRVTLLLSPKERQRCVGYIK